MVKRVLVGIDPGQRGAIAVFGPDGLDVRDLQSCYRATGTFSSLDPLQFRSLITLMIPYESSEVITYCEESILKSSNGIKTARPVYDSRGVIRSILAIRNLDCLFVAPISWKSHFNLLRTSKSASIAKVVEHFPDYRHLFYRNYRGREIELDGRAEAVLIALYGRDMEKK